MVERRHALGILPQLRQHLPLLPAENDPQGAGNLAAGRNITAVAGINGSQDKLHWFNLTPG